MAYNASYDEGDIAESAINTVVKMVIGIGIFAFLIVLVFLLGWFRKRV